METNPLYATGAKLRALYLGEGGVVKVGSCKCESITVDCAPGPMGYYAVAVVRYSEGSSMIYPLHLVATWEAAR